MDNINVNKLIMKRNNMKTFKFAIAMIDLSIAITIIYTLTIAISNVI